MTPNHDLHDDPVLTALRSLPTWDVDQRRARRLGARCRWVLAAETRATGAARAVPARWPRVTAIAVLAAWCAVYLAEVVRRGATAWVP